MDFMIGCNYWASHAGTDMWKNWDEKTVENDLALLKKSEINTLRVFINWRDFQPVKALYTAGFNLKGYVLEGDRASENPWYLDEIMLQRFGKFCDLCEKYGLRLIVGIVTGWMSGRMFAPVALEGRNVYTDPVSLSFQIKLVTGIVSRFKNKKAIYAWNLGNECNCMSSCASREIAYNWSMLIANTIRANDPVRPVISGMHGLKVENASWLISDQAEATDMLTTHPYAYFVPHCMNDPIYSIRTLMHGTAETLLYSQLGKKPCLVEELGTLSNSLCSDEASALFMNVSLFSSWANCSPGVLWWCGFEQSHLSAPPYSWNMLERELGLHDKNFKPKKYLEKMTAFAKWLKETKATPEVPVPDVKILFTRDQDQWGIGYMSYILLKQAGLEPEFVLPNTEIPASSAYVLPSCHGQGCLYKEYYDQLKKQVENGATLYVSNFDGFFTEAEEFFGFITEGVEQKSDIKGEFMLEDATIPYAYSQRRILTATSATVLAVDEKVNPLLTVNAYGLGRVFFLNFPLEEMLLPESYAFEGERHKLFEIIFKNVLENKKVRSNNSKAIVTQGKNLVTVINFSNVTVSPELTFNNTKVTEILYGSLNTLLPGEAAVFRVE
jgi:hypothetical protein